MDDINAAMRSPRLGLALLTRGPTSMLPPVWRPIHARLIRRTRCPILSRFTSSARCPIPSWLIFLSMKSG
eukprot:7619637-Pyramimonas_sp.AAC.1